MQRAWEKLSILFENLKMSQLEEIELFKLQLKS
jgi:hypothetical protein